MLILSTAIVNPPGINTWGNHLFTRRLKLTVDRLNSDHLHSDRLISNHRSSPLEQQLSQQQLLILPPPQNSDHLNSDLNSNHWQCWALICPGRHCWSLIHPGSTLSIDPPPPDSNFRIFNILIFIHTDEKCPHKEIYSHKDG